MQGISALMPAISSTSSLPTDVGTALLSKQLDTIDDMGESMVKMMENAVTPYLGGNFDMSV